MELVLIRGLPGSGKTTRALEFKALGYEHCEADHYFEQEDGAYKFDPSKLKDAHALCFERCQSALLSGQSCVVSNTFTQRWEALPYIHLAQSLNIPVRIVTCAGDYGSIHNVPTEAIARMRERWELL